MNQSQIYECVKDTPVVGVHCNAIAKGETVKLKRIVPYIICGLSMLMPSEGPNAYNKPEKTNKTNNKSNTNTNIITAWTYNTNKQISQCIDSVCLDNKANTMRDIYVQNMLRAQKKLKPLMGKREYFAAVKKELPGAPVGQHCMWGQYTQLKRALQQMGDTVTIIPDGARTACSQFKSQMRDKYKSEEYTGCIFEGKVFETKSQYLAELDKYLARHKITHNTNDSVRLTAIKQFQTNHKYADTLEPGTILIVPRHRGSKNQFHAIMYLGRGYVLSEAFVPNANGAHIYAGHNRENIGQLFQTYDMSNVFAADTKQIAKAEYTKELNQIQNMNNGDLIRFLGDSCQHTSTLNMFPRWVLVRMACDKYFQKQNNTTPVNTPVVNTLLNPSHAVIEFLKNGYRQHSI